MLSRAYLLPNASQAILFEPSLLEELFPISRTFSGSEERALRRPKAVSVFNSFYAKYGSFACCRLLVVSD